MNRISGRYCNWAKSCLTCSSVEGPHAVCFHELGAGEWTVHRLAHRWLARAAWLNGARRRLPVRVASKCLRSYPSEPRTQRQNPQKLHKAPPTLVGGHHRAEQGRGLGSLPFRAAQSQNRLSVLEPNIPGHGLLCGVKLPPIFSKQLSSLSRLRERPRPSRWPKWCQSLGH